MSIKKNVYITFYQKMGDTLFINNSFSFGREDMDDNYTDIFIDRNASSEEIEAKLKRISYPIEKVFVSIVSQEELLCLLPFIDAKWVIGGNNYSFMYSSKKRSLANLPEILKTLSCTITPMPIETYFKKPNSAYSSHFSYYFKPLVEESGICQLVYRCPLGAGCYWNRCKFCGIKFCNSERYLRENITGILQQLPPNTMGGTSQVQMGLPSVDPYTLYEILNMDWNRTISPVMFVRADNEIIKVLESFDPGDKVCMKKRISMGIEILSDTALHILNKGTTVDKVLRTIELLLSHGAMIEMSIMTNYPFLNHQIVKEALAGYKRLKQLHRAYPGSSNYIWFVNNGDIFWPSEEIVSEYAKTYEKLELPNKIFVGTDPDGKNFKLYKAIIPVDSDVFRFNRIIEEAVLNTGIMSG